jgi:transcriptional regulator with XRE-family HTH domain
MKIGKLNVILRVARQEKGIKQGELAKMAGIKQSKLSRIEGGATAPVSSELWELLFEKLGYSISYKLKACEYHGK